jgi:sporulation protein YlmC with PRC-barrel domain
VNSEKLKGMKVTTSKAYILGEVKGFEVDTENWRVTDLHVKLTDEASTQLGFKRRFRSSTVCMSINLINAVGDLVTIDKSLDELERSSDVKACKNIKPHR